MRSRLVAIAAFVTLLGGIPGALNRQSPPAGPNLRGAWVPEQYLLKTGERHPVTGLIFFSASDWGVTFFVTPPGQAPQRASAEGGSYTLDGTKLVFKHHYIFAGGNALPGLPASPMRMEVRDPMKAPLEPVSVAIEGTRLTISFPSGNTMTFRRSSS
jgi:hypothetical protein